METATSGPVKNVMELVGGPEGDPSRPRRIRFWFYSGEEAVIYRLAAALKKRGYEIELERGSGRYRWLCIAHRVYVPAEEPLHSLCGEMMRLTRRFEVIFEGWEHFFIPEKGAKAV